MLVIQPTPDTAEVGAIYPTILFVPLPDHCHPVPLAWFAADEALSFPIVPP